MQIKKHYRKAWVNQCRNTALYDFAYVPMDFSVSPVSIIVVNIFALIFTTIHAVVEIILMGLH